MAFLLRKIEKRKWNKEEAKKLTWLKDACPADTVFDLKTEKNSLSFWYINDDYSNVELVAVAIACSRENLDPVDYGLISIEAIQQIGVKMIANPSDTAFSAANSWHRDLIEISVGKLASLAQTMWNQIEPQRVSEKAILERIVSGVASGDLDRTKIKITSEKLLRRLDAL